MKKDQSLFFVTIHIFKSLYTIILLKPFLDYLSRKLIKLSFPK